MTSDTFQDVFPVSFDFKQGEQPTGTKFTGWVQQTDQAFTRFTQAFGDPWEYNQHTGGPSSSAYYLSPERLAQTSLARILGPSDYCSPSGGCFAESIGGSGVSVTLSKDRNSWCLGFPLVKVTGTLAPDSSISGVVTALDWGDVSTSSSVFSSEKSSLEDVDASGDFYVDYYRGLVYTYDSPTSDVTLTISDLHMFSGGVPWGTHNVIPTWSQTVGLCNVHTKVNYSDYSTYLVDLPTVSAAPRTSATNILGASKPYDGSSTPSDVTYSYSCSGSSSSYRLPYSLVSSLQDGDEIPEGFMLLWDEVSGRIVSQVTFYYKSTTQVQVSTPLDWLTLGDSTYRILVTGTSMAESIEYLTDVVRDNRHVGLTYGSSARGTLAYTAPLSHADLADLWCGEIDSTLYSDEFHFRKSSYPTNDHPQYLHRAGWMRDDEDGNSANAMRGSLVFSRVTDFAVGTGVGSSDGGLYTSTSGIYFGSGDSSTQPHIDWSGGPGSYWGSGAANQLGFDQAIGVKAEEAGAVSYYPYKGSPLYLRGMASFSIAKAYQGATLGFELYRWGEMNYLKLMSATDQVDTNGDTDLQRDYTAEPVIQPAYTGQTSWADSLDIMPHVSNRVAPSQVREFRFRAVSYVAGATDSGGAGGSGLGSTGTEFEKYFVSPAMVGADWFNVYGNAIFFSDQGTGTKTSFVENGKSWLGSNQTKPTGIYYVPRDPSDGTSRAHFAFSTNSISYGLEEVLHIGFDEGFVVKRHGTSSGIAGDIDLNTAGDIILTAGDDLRVIVSDVIDMDSTGATNITAGGYLGLNSGTYMYFKAPPTSYMKLYTTSTSPTANTGDITIRAQGDVDISSVSQVLIDASTSIEITSASYITLYTDTLQLVTLPSGTGDPLVLDGTQVKANRSSIKYKENISPIKDVSWVYQLEPVKFNFKNESVPQYGLIAEEVEVINKELVRYDGDKVGSVYYNSVFSALIKAVQEQKKEIENLKTQLNN